MKQPQYNTALYMRLSRDDETFGDSVSIETQRTVLTQYVREHPEFHVVSEFADDGWSGTNFDRPQFKQMMEEIEAGNINCVITKDGCVNIELNSESPQKCGFCDVSSVF